MTILVKAYFNTDSNGVWVYDDVDDIEDLPICYFGPFDSISDAVSWMENDYPDDDEDLYEMVADDFDFGSEVYVNDPSSIFGDIPDEDIRDDDDAPAV